MVGILAAQRNGQTFQFNTYVIAVLVIFFLQMNYGLPAIGVIVMASEDKTTDAASYAKSNAEKTKDLNKMLADFFHFYGGRYEINNHLISTSIGRWQEQRLTGQQKYFTPEQKRLRDGIGANPVNWQKCTMFVQDLVDAAVNVCADITKEEAYNFQEMCQMFSTGRKSSPVKRVPKPLLSSSPAAHLQSVRKAFSHSSLNDTKPSANHAVITTKTDKPKSPVTAITFEAVSNTMKKVATAKKVVAKVSVLLENAIKDGNFCKLINVELDTIRSDERNRHETRILGILKQHFKIFDRALVLIPFGSTAFGFASCKSNFNIFVDTRTLPDQNPIILSAD